MHAAIAAAIALMEHTVAAMGENLQAGQQQLRNDAAAMPVVLLVVREETAESTSCSESADAPDSPNAQN